MLEYDLGLVEIEGVAEALGSLPFGFLTEKFDVPQLTDVTHVCSRTRAHVHAIADLNNSERRDARGKEIHVGSVCGHDGIDFIAVITASVTSKCWSIRSLAADTKSLSIVSSNEMGLKSIRDRSA